MTMIIDRPNTPPPMTYGDAQLLTPPPTAKFDKRIIFAENALGNLARALDKNDLLTSPTISTVVTKPFPFMRLPPYVRKKVYEYLLVVPALICVGQNHRVSQEQGGAHVYTESRELTPGIAYALAQLTVDGAKVRFSKFALANSNILLASKEVHAEARAILYGKNDFDIAKPSTELNPPSDYSVRLFPSGCQRLVTKLNIRSRSFYDLHWLFSGGYKVIKNYYRGLTTLTLILELQSTSKGFGKQWTSTEGEKSLAYIMRLRAVLGCAFSAPLKERRAIKVPAWIDLCVMFSGESYHEQLSGVNTATGNLTKHEELRNALTEAWRMLRKGSR